MSAEALLSRLEAVKRTGPERWIARCPAHADKTPSLSVRALDDGRVLLHCFAGCAVEQIVGAAGVELGELFPPRTPKSDSLPRERRPFLPADVFDVARREIGVVAIIGADMHKGRQISEADYQRLFVAVDRLAGIARAAYERR